MKTLLATAAFVAASLLPVGEAAAQETVTAEAATVEKLHEARAILEAIYPTAERDQIFRNIAGTISNQYGQAALKDPLFDDPGLRAIMNDFLAEIPQMLAPVIRTHMPEVFEATTVAYAREFTLEELREIRTFASTPAGSHYFRKSSELLADPAVAEANGRYFEAISKLQNEARQVVEAKIRKYFEDNPQALKQLEQKAVPADVSK